MIYLIHGADSAKSRLKLKEITGSAKKELIYLDGKKMILSDLIVACESLSLFSLEKTVVIENFFQRKLSREKTDCQKYVFNTELDPDVIFWENTEIEKIKLSRLPKNITVYKFDYPANLFKFLDSLGFASSRELLQKFQILNKVNDPELIFTMLVRQLRYLIIVRDDDKNTGSLPPWQYFKFKSQSRIFTQEKLISLYRKLLQLDFQMKSGMTSYGKKELLDIYLVNI